MRFYYVNPTNITDITGPYVLNQVQAVLPDGRVIERILGAVPEWHLYEAYEDETPPPLYYTGAGKSLTFSGGIGTPSARVIETNQFARISIEELYNEKKHELSAYTETVFFSSFKMTAGGGAMFWVNASLVARLYRTDVDAYYQWQQIQTGTITWRNIPVWLVRVDNGNEVKIKADQSQWGDELKEAQGRFSIDVAYSADEVDDIIDTAYNDGAGDWDTLAAIDVETAPVTNPWPEHGVGVFNGLAST